MITIDTHGTPFVSSLREAYDRLGDLTPLMQAIGVELEGCIQERFELRMDPSGDPWATWAESTRRYYPVGGNRKLLDRYGDMLASLNSQPSSDSVQIGFGVPYATYHEWGTKHMPRRGMLFDNPAAGTLSDDDSRAVLDVIGDFLADL